MDIPEDAQLTLNNVKSKLQIAIDEIRGRDKYVFVKSSCRSPKDVSLISRSFLENYHHSFNALEDKDDNARMVAMLQASFLSLRSESAEDVILTFCQSERIYNDLLLALEYPDRFKQNFVVRKWVDIDIDLEFRGFVKNCQFCAVSQYNILPFFPRLVEMKDDLLEKMVTFFEEQINPRLKDHFQDYIIDFAFTGESHEKNLDYRTEPILEQQRCMFVFMATRLRDIRLTTT